MNQRSKLRAKPEFRHEVDIPNEPLMTVAEVAQYLRVSPYFVYQHQ